MEESQSIGLAQSTGNAYIIADDDNVRDPMDFITSIELNFAPYASSDGVIQ